MKKVISAVAVTLAICFAGTANADSMRIITDVEIDNTRQVTQTEYPLPGLKSHTVKIAGKTCELVGSALNGAVQGCNFSLTIAENGNVYVKDRTHNCAAQSGIPNTCK